MHVRSRGGGAAGRLPPPDRPGRQTGRQRAGAVDRAGEPGGGADAALHAAAPSPGPGPRGPLRAHQRQPLRRADRLGRRRRFRTARRHRRLLPPPRPGHPHPHRRLGGPLLPRPGLPRPAIPGLRPRTGSPAVVVPSAGAGDGGRAEEHLLRGPGPAGLRVPPHRRPRELRDLRLLPGRDRALLPPLRGPAGGRRPRPPPGVPVHQARPRPRRPRRRRARTHRRAAPPRPHRLLPGRQRRRGPGHRRRLRRPRVRARRHHLGRRDPRRRPGRLRAGRPPGAGGDARRGGRHQGTVADGRRLPRRRLRGCGSRRPASRAAPRRPLDAASSAWPGPGCRPR